MSKIRKSVGVACALVALGTAWPQAGATTSVSPGTLQQTQGQCQGVVVDAKGETIIGANVMVKGTTLGVATDLDGRFALSGVKVGAILEISSVGYITQEVRYTGAPLKVVLQEDNQSLQELVVVGYTTQKRESLTGAISSIKADKLKGITSPSVENLLNGKAPGVYVAPGSGQPGSSGAVVIRGQATLSGTTAPLWVIDGVIVGSGAGQLNPADIETMTILKDAASTAIYGSQGANGVIVVTTKSGRAGAMSISLDMKAGISRLNTGNLRMMTGSELYDYYQSFANASDIKFARWTPELRNSNFDWWDLATQSGIAQDYNVSIQGGSDKISGIFSLGYYDEEGAVKGYDYQRYNFRTRVTFKPFSWLTIKPSLSGALRKVENRQYSVGAMYSMLPWDSPYDADGNLVPNRYSGWVNSQANNYLNDLQWNYGKGDHYEFMGNFDFDVRLTDWLTFSSVNNLKYTHNAEQGYEDPRSVGGQSVKGRISGWSDDMTRRYTNQKLLINKSWGDHLLSGLVAYEFNDYRYSTMQAIGTGFVPGFEVLDVTAKPERTKGGITEWAVQSFFSSFKYAYDNRYYAEASLRRDGASNFGDNAKYGNFFSLSGGWVINREKWFSADWVNNLKLRLSYGSQGNRPSSLYPQYDLYTVSAVYNENSGALISQIGNKDLTWEQTYTTGVGADLAAFDNRLRFSADFYLKETDNILYQVPITGLVGVTSMWRNIGKMRNVGLELALGVDILRGKDWNWSLEANLGFNRNKLTDIYRQKDVDGTMVAKPVIIGDGSGIAGSADMILEIGEPIDTYYLREWAGVNPQNGAPMWYKYDADGNRTTTSVYTEAQQRKVGTRSPKVFGGFSTNLSWRQFDLSANFGYSIGGQIYNYSRLEYDSDGTYTDRNQMALQKGWTRWQKEGDIATHPIARYNNSDKGNNASSRYLEDASFLKLRSLTLGYNFDLLRYGIKQARLFITGENLLTITDYSGVDPELPASGGSVMGTAGPSVYPSVRKFMLGLNLTF